MELHWILTLQMPGQTVLTRYGVFTVAKGSTRSQVFGKVRESVVNEFPHMANANTVFWSLEPNQL